MSTEYITLVKSISRNYCVMLASNRRSADVGGSVLVNRKLGCLVKCQLRLSRDTWRETYAGRLESILLELAIVMVRQIWRRRRNWRQRCSSLRGSQDLMFQGRGQRRQMSRVVVRMGQCCASGPTNHNALMTFQSIQPRRTDTESSEWRSKTLVFGESCLDCGKVARRPH